MTTSPWPSPVEASSINMCTFMQREQSNYVPCSNINIYFLPLRQDVTNTNDNWHTICGSANSCIYYHNNQKPKVADHILTSDLCAIVIYMMMISVSGVRVKRTRSLSRKMAAARVMTTLHLAMDLRFIYDMSMVDQSHSHKLGWYNTVLFHSPNWSTCQMF